MFAVEMPSNWQILMAKTCCRTFFPIVRVDTCIHANNESLLNLNCKDMSILAG